LGSSFGTSIGCYSTGFGASTTGATAITSGSLISSFSSAEGLIFFSFFLGASTVSKSSTSASVFCSGLKFAGFLA